MVPNITYATIESESINTSVLLFFVPCFAPDLYQDNKARDKRASVTIKSPSLMNRAGYRMIVLYCERISICTITNTIIATNTYCTIITAV